MSSVDIPFSNQKELVKEKFRELKTVQDFSKLLTYIERELMFPDVETKPLEINAKHLYYLSKNANSKYKEFVIPKKNGGSRKIEAPEPFLKRIQSSINVLFQIVFFDSLNHFTNGFVFERNIIRNAKPHLYKRFVLNIDIENFFPSIEFRRIKTVLELDPFNLIGDREKIGFIVSNICCLNGHLPQGSPASPILSNIVTQRLDRKLASYALSKKIKYSRYADDLSFSCNQNLFKKKLISEINSIIQNENFKVNKEKTRIKSNREHQEITGIVVNEKLNVRRNYLKSIRTMLNNWDKGGIHFAEKRFLETEGHLINKDFTNVLGGRIGYIGMVRGNEDPLFLKYKTRFSLLKHKVDYSGISNVAVKKRLIDDNYQMEKIVLDKVHNPNYKFIAFCTSAFHQIENLTNYFYWTRYPNIKDLLNFLLDNNPDFKSKYNNYDACRHNFKTIGKLPIHFLIYLIEKEFYFDRGISYHQEIRMLRDIRNDDSHRCEIDKIDMQKTIAEYEKIKEKWKRFQIRHQRFPEKQKKELDIEYDYRLIQFLNHKNYNSVRKTLKKVSLEVQKWLENVSKTSPTAQNT